jgi:hypothetical protein
MVANSAQAFDEVMSTIRTASIRGFGGSTPKRVGISPLSTQRQNLRLGRDDKVLVEGIGMSLDLDPFAAAGNDRKHRRPGSNDPHIVLQLRHVFLGSSFFRKRPRLEVPDPLRTCRDVIRSLTSIDRGRPCDLPTPPSVPSTEPERSAEAVRRALPELLKLDRYERRATARRDRATRHLIARKMPTNNQ